MIPPIDVVRVLNRAKVKFTLVGAHALGSWTRKPRTTDDVDVVVAARHIKRAVTSLTQAFPDLKPLDLPFVVRLCRGESSTVVIDVMKPNQPIIHASLSHVHRVKVGRDEYRIPSLEMALALKFAAMINLLRPEAEKHQDAHDFLAAIRANPEIDLEILSELGELVYSGGGKEIVSMVTKVRAGERLVI